MTPPEPYAGMDVYTNGGERVGRVKQGHGDGDPQPSEYLTIHRPRARDIVVPRSILRLSKDRLVLPFGMNVVEGAPNVSLHRRAMTVEEKWILDSCYSLWTGMTVTPIEIVKGQYNKPEREGADMKEKAKQATDRAKAAADQIIEKAKAQGAELIERSKIKEAELREKAKQQAAELREKAKKDAAELREKGQKDAAELREKAKQQGADLLARARQDAAALRKKAKQEAKAHRPKAKDTVA